MTYPWNNSTTWSGTDPWPGPDSGGGPVTLTVTPQPDNVPPRIRIDIDDATGSISSVTLRRLDPDGRYRNVRTSDDAPLPLDAGAGTVYDYEMPLGRAVTYSLTVAGSPSVTVTLDSDRIWLNHPQVPSRSVPIDLRVGSNDEESWDLDQGVFQILERPDPIVATSGARLLPASSLIVSIESLDQLAALRLLLADGAVLLLNVPPSAGVGIETCYIAVGRVSPRRRPGDFGNSGFRDVDMPYQTVGRPAGGTQAAVSWNDYATVGDDDYTAAESSQFATWDELAVAYGSWSALSAPTV